MDKRMKKGFLRALALAFAVCFLFSVFPFSSSAALNCTVNGEKYATLEAVGGKVTLPKAPSGISGAFAGWVLTVGGEEKLYPPGATVSVSGNATATALTLSFITRSVAEMRISDEDIALRFLTDFQKGDYQRLRKLVGDAGIKVGTYITVREYMMLTDGVFTSEALESRDCAYLDVAANGFYTEEAAFYTLAGSVGSIRDENRARSYVGVGYLKLTYADGSVGTVYSPFDYNQNCYTPFDAVLDAYEDRYYGYPNTVPTSSVHGGEKSTSSPYTLPQLDRMKAFLDTVGSVALTLGEQGEYMYVPTTAKYYDSPWLVSYEYVNEEDEIFSVTLTAPEGKTVEDIKSFLFVGSRIPLTAEGVTVTETSITATHSNYTPEY